MDHYVIVISVIPSHLFFFPKILLLYFLRTHFASYARTSCILEKLREKVSKMYFFTIPPVPRPNQAQIFFKKIQNVNDFMMGWPQGKDIDVFYMVNTCSNKAYQMNENMSQFLTLKLFYLFILFFQGNICKCFHYPTFSVLMESCQTPF